MTFSLLCTPRVPEYLHIWKELLSERTIEPAQQLLLRAGLSPCFGVVQFLMCVYQTLSPKVLTHWHCGSQRLLQRHSKKKFGHDTGNNVWEIH